MKPLSTNWSIEMFHYLVSNPNIIINGNFSLKLLHIQYPLIRGLWSSLLPIVRICNLVDNYCYGKHWVCASTIGCGDGVVYIYYSLCSRVSESTQVLLAKNFPYQ